MYHKRYLETVIRAFHSNMMTYVPRMFLRSSELVTVTITAVVMIECSSLLNLDVPALSHGSAAYIGLAMPAMLHRTE